MSQEIEIKVPDIGQSGDVDVIEVLVKAGDTIAVDDPIITLESEKASMDVPTPYAGVVKSVKVKVDDKVSEGSVILILETEEAVAKPQEESKQEDKAVEKKETVATSTTTTTKEPMAIPDDIHAGPAVRRLAHVH